MPRLRILLFIAVLAGLLCANVASAQTVSIVAGNGQVICICPQSAFQFFDPVVVKVTDTASGNPLPNAAVSWALTSGNGTLSQTQTFTDANGQTSNLYIQSTVPGTPLQPFVQSTIVASAGSSSVTFTLTQGLSDVLTGVQYLQVNLVSPVIGSTITGSIGSQSATPIQVTMKSVTGVPVPNASVRLISDQDPTQGPVVNCVTAAGADPGAVLTDATGSATCTPIFSGTAGSGTFSVLVGGVASGISYQGNPIGYYDSNKFHMTVAPGTPGMIQITSGDKQTGNPGQAVASPLVAKVADASGNGLAGQPVTWSVSPTGAATLTNTTNTSGANGQVSTNVTLTNSAAGTIQVKVALTSNPTLSATFTVGTNITISGLQLLSGNQQSAAVNTAFADPLVVQVNGTNGQPLANFPVQFTVTGPALVSTSSVNTSSTGRAQVTVQAGPTTGAVAVVAAAGGFTQTFNLTVTPAGPNLTSSSFYNGADFKQGSISPCSIATIIASGLAPGVQGVVAPPLFGPLPYQIALGTAGTVLKVSFNNSQAPIYNVVNQNGQESVTVQVPCDVTPGNNVQATVTLGSTPKTVSVPVLPASPGIFQTQMSDGRMRAVLVRSDGSFVSLENPARPGELIRMYATGLGLTNPAVPTNQVAVPGVDSMVLGQLIVGVNNAGVRVVSARVAPNLIGVYEVVFQLPTDVATGNNVVLSLAVNPTDGSATQFSAGSSIPIQ
ncbi:MAG TPA: hypothetical protein VG675_21550 [Bryobacteraceae bacterium]|nr:hypothetical protein [Bryobacteraceae bacterium]